VALDGGAADDHETRLHHPLDPQYRGGMMTRLGSIGGRLYRGEVSVDFVGKRKMWYSISGLIVLASLIAVLVGGLTFSVEFKGGSVFSVNNAPASVSATQVQKAVSDGGITDSIVQHVGAGGRASWQIQTKSLDPDQTNKVSTSLHSELGVSSGSISVKSVSGSWGSQISQKAVQALIAFLIVIVIYLSIAFEWKMAAAAFVALLHTLVITVGAYAIIGFEVSPATVIGFLTILGYALYDTVVVFDKVRENAAGLLGGARQTYSDAANLALNQTLVRSINTSVIALLPVGAILFVGGGLLGVGELKDLSLVLFVGILAGAYASICIATPVLTQLKEREPQYRALAKRVALRASGGPRAKKAAVKAGTGANGGYQTAAADDRDPVDDRDDIDDVAEDDDLAGSQPARGAAGRPAAGARSVGARQQPRRSGQASTARRRPAGKKKRR
jgi:preprotein translocase subunit SecF